MNAPEPLRSDALTVPRVRAAMNDPSVTDATREALTKAFIAANIWDTQAVIGLVRGLPTSPQFKPVNAVDPFGLSLLHTAIARNNPMLTWWLIERGASFFADGEGRMPSTMAFVMEVDECLVDLVASAEEHAFDNIGNTNPQPFELTDELRHFLAEAEAAAKLPTEQFDAGVPPGFNVQLTDVKTPAEGDASLRSTKVE